jgi:LacI family transcriptional regulator
VSTLKDVADRAGVTIPVVSAYIRGSKYVRMSQETRGRIAAAIDEVGYVPNLAARSLRTSRTNIIAVVVPKLDNPALAELLRGIYDRAGAAGYVIMLGDGAQLTSGSKMLEHFSAQGTVDGFIVRRSSALDPHIMSDLVARGLPVVFLDNESGTDHNWLAPDDADGIRVATEHLIGLGHVRVGFLGGADVGFTTLRYSGYVTAMTAHGLKPMPLVHCGQAPEQGYDAFAGTLAESVVRRRRGAPTALVVNNATTAIGVLAAALDAGLSVPDDLSIVGHHDIALASLVRPKLTTVTMPMYEIGAAGVDMLDAIVNRQPVTSRILDDIKPQMRPRDSSAPPGAPAPRADQK